MAGAASYVLETGPPSFILDGHPACADVEDKEIFFPMPGETGAEARAVCRRCPLRRPCGAWALDQPHLAGVWGGMTERERRSWQRTVEQL